jgi:hypothetical protein
MFFLAPSKTHPVVLCRALLNAHGVKGELMLRQDSILSGTRVTLNVTEVAEPVLGGFRIHSFPSRPPLVPPTPDAPLHSCTGIGDVFNPTGKGVASEAPIPGKASNSQP